MHTAGDYGEATATCAACGHQQAIIIRAHADGTRSARYKRGRPKSGAAMVAVGVKAPAWMAAHLATDGMTHHRLHKWAMSEWMKKHPRTLDSGDEL